MMDRNERGEGSTNRLDEREVEELVREAGARVEPPMEDLQAIRKAVRAEWLKKEAVNPMPEPVRPDFKPRRSGLPEWLPIAAVLAGVLLAGGWLLSYLAAPAAVPGLVVARVEKVVGTVRAGGRELSSGGEVRLGDSLETAAVAGLAIRVGGRSVRLAESSIVRLTTENRLELVRGAVYVDSAPGAPSPGLEVVTAYGWVREIGTQFEVRVATGESERLVVRVREGRVVMEGVNLDCSDASAGVCEASASGSMTLDSSGKVRFEPTPVHGESWTAYLDLAALPDTDNALRVISWAAREAGLRLEWADEEVREFAAAQRYHGVDQAPDLVLENAVRSLGLAYEASDDAVVISR